MTVLSAHYMHVRYVSLTGFVKSWSRLHRNWNIIVPYFFLSLKVAGDSGGLGDWEQLTEHNSFNNEFFGQNDTCEHWDAVLCFLVGWCVDSFG